MARRTTRSASERASDLPPTWDETLIRTLAPLKVEMTGGLLILVALVTILAQLGMLTWSYLTGWSNLLYQLFGWGLYPLCLLVVIVGLYLMLRRANGRLPFQLRPTHIIGVELLLLASLPLTYQWTGATLQNAYQGEGGGLVGWALAAPTLDFLGPLLTAVLYGGLGLFGVLLVLGVRWQQVHQWLATLSDRFEQWSRRLEPEPRPAQKPRKPERPATPPRLIDHAAHLDQPAAPPAGRDRRLPPLKLLDKGTMVQLSEAELQAKQRIVEQTLVDFGLTGRVKEIRHGPAVTQFGVQPGYLE